MPNERALNEGAPNEGAPNARALRRARGFVLLIVFVDMLAASMAIPIIPGLLLSILHGSTGSTARMLGLLGTMFAVMQFLFGPLQGALSDRFGRRPILIVSCLGLAVSLAMTALATDRTTLFAGRALSGISAANISTATAYLADILPPAERAGAFALVGAAFGGGLVLGPVIGGLLGGIGIRVPFWAAAGVALANTAWALFKLPESLAPALRSKVTWAASNPLGALAFLASDRRLISLGFCGFMSLLAQQSLISIFVLSATLRFGWGFRAVGIAMASVALCYALAGVVLVPRIVRRYGELVSLVAGIVFGVLGFCVLAVAWNGWIFTLAIPTIALWGLAAPATQSAMSRLVSAEEQGRLQGAGTSIGGLAGIVGPTMFAWALAWGLAGRGAFHAPGLPFVIAAMLLLISAPVAIRALRGGPSPAA